MFQSGQTEKTKISKIVRFFFTPVAIKKSTENKVVKRNRELSARAGRKIEEKEKDIKSNL